MRPFLTFVFLNFFLIWGGGIRIRACQTGFFEGGFRFCFFRVGDMGFFRGGGGESWRKGDGMGWGKEKENRGKGKNIFLFFFSIFFFHFSDPSKHLNTQPPFPPPPPSSPEIHPLQLKPDQRRATLAKDPKLAVMAPGELEIVDRECGADAHEEDAVRVEDVDSV